MNEILKEIGVLTVGLLALGAGAISMQKHESEQAPKPRSEIKETIPEVQNQKKVELGKNNFHVGW